MYIQQGDVLIKRTDLKPKGKAFKGSLLHKGQQHHHRLSGGAFTIKEGPEGKFLTVTRATKLTHEEHKTLSIPKGTYKIEIVQEYDHWLEESRAVID